MTRANESFVHPFNTDFGVDCCLTITRLFAVAQVSNPMKLNRGCLKYPSSYDKQQACQVDNALIFMNFYYWALMLVGTTDSDGLMQTWITLW